MRKSIALAIAVSAMSFLFGSTANAATEDQDPPSIVVQGEGKTSAKPDLATVELGVVAEAKTAARALADNSAAMTALLKTVSDQGIAERDIQTSNLSINPTYTSAPNNPARISGYSVRNSVHVRLHKISNLGPLLDAVVQSGANSVYGINFSVENPSKLLDDARKEAVEDARRKATIYAQAAGVQLGKVLFVIESHGAPSGIRPMMKMAAMDYAASTPIASGEQELSVSATVVFAIH